MRELHTKSTSFLLLIFTILLVVPVPASAAEDADVEAFRNDLLVYVDQLGRLPDGVLGKLGAEESNLIRSSDAIRKMNAEDLRVLQTQMELVPYWQQLPTVIALQMRNSAPSPRELAGQLASTTGALSPDTVRSQLLTMVGVFRNIPAEQFSPGYQGRVDQLESMIIGASGEDLLSLSQDFDQNMTRWQDQLRLATEDPVAYRKSAAAMTLQNHCGSSFPADVWCVMNHIFTDIANFFVALPGHAQNALDQITGIFTSIAGTFASGASSLVNLVINELGLNSIDWAAVASAADTYARLPCPPDGMLLPGFGTVGEIRTATNYNGTIGFAGNAITNLLPSDILTSADIQAIAQVLNFPVQWLGTCLQGAYDDRFDTAQSTHRDHVTTNLDVVASTRASQASLDSAQAQEIDLDADVVMIEAKLDRLNATSNRSEATTDRTIVLLDRLETTTERLDGKSDDLESKIENLQIQQGQTSGQLEEMQESMLRMFIEKDLFGNGTARIGLFQIPAAQGGFLDLAVQIVGETIASREAAGVSMERADKEYAESLAQQASGNYKGAYDLLRAAYRKAVN